MQRLEVSGAVRHIYIYIYIYIYTHIHTHTHIYIHIYIYVIRRLKVNKCLDNAGDYVEK